MRTSQVDVLGVPVSAVNMDMVLKEFKAMVDERACEFVCVTGVHGVMESQRDPYILAAHKAAGIVTPDGMPLVWLGRRAGAKWMDRVYGPDLVLAACQAGVAKGWRHFFYGGTEGTARAMAEELQRRVPDMQLAGFGTPPFRPLTDAEVSELRESLHASGADILWIGLSTPKQELFMAQHHDRLGVPICVGVGAAFDFYAGTVRQAPRIVQRSGFEWAFRLAMEPRRLWKRYLRNNPAFIAKVVSRHPKLRHQG